MQAKTTTRVPELPSELVDHILDFLAPESTTSSNRETLASCTLACRAWLPRSSHHLLRAVNLSVMDWSTFSQDLAFANASPRLRTHARMLCVSGTFDVSEHLAAIYAALPQLRGFQFTNNWKEFFSWPDDYALDIQLEAADEHCGATHGHSGQESPRCASSAYEIDELVLYNHTPPLMPYFLRLFRRISVLELEERGVPVPQLETTTSEVESYLENQENVRYWFGRVLKLRLPIAVDVDTLLLHDTCRLWVFVVSSLTAFQPRKIVLKDASNQSLRLLLCFLRDCDRNLEELVLVITQNFPAPQPNHAIYGSLPTHKLVLPPNRCPVLQTVTIDIRTSQANSRRCRSVLWHLPSSMLRTLVIKLRRRQLVKTLRDIAAALREPEQDYRGLQAIELRGLGDGRELLPRSLAIINRHVDEELRMDFYGGVMVSS